MLGYGDKYIGFRISTKPNKSLELTGVVPSGSGHLATLQRYGRSDTGLQLNSLLYALIGIGYV